MAFRLVAVLTVIAIMGVSADAQAQEKCGGSTGNYNAKGLLDLTLNRPVGADNKAGPLLLTAKATNPLRAESEPQQIGSKRSLEESAAAGSMIRVELARPALMEISNDVWSSVYTFGAAETERKEDIKGRVNPPIKQDPVGVFIRERGPNHLLLDVVVPKNPDLLSVETWRIVPILCNGKTHELIGYGVASVKVTGPELAWMISLGAIAIFWMSITFAAWQLNSARLEELWNKNYPTKQDNQPMKMNDLRDPAKRHRLMWTLAQAANPIFIAQDSLGYGSLSRFQILFFTTVVGFVLLHIFVHSGVLSPMSNTILMLLGITVVGGSLARASSDWSGISARSRSFLLGAHILKIRRGDKPRFSDLLETQGEVDVAKVQAPLFTCLVAISIMVLGLVTGLGAFELPEQIVYLTGISQAAYVFGRLVPAGTRKRLEEDLAQLQTAAAALRNANPAPANPAPANPQLQQLRNSFEQAKQAAASTLAETYLDRFNDQKFKNITEYDV